MKPFALAALAALVATSALAAQPMAKQPRAARGDANGDGVLSQAEFQAQQSQRMMRLDGDGDGRISLAEWSAAPSGPKTGGRDPARAFGLVDRNRDGAIDASELQAVSARRFARLDSDKDGRLTVAERRAQMQAQRGARAAAKP